MHTGQIPHVIFESTSTFPLNFASISSAITHNSSVLFLAQTYTLVKGANQRAIFLDFRQVNDKSIPLQILHYSLL